MIKSQEAKENKNAKAREYSRARRASGQMKTPSGSPQKPKFERAQFVVWDGEGYNIIPDKPETHVYWLLCCIDSRTGNRHHIEAPTGKYLHTKDILKFIAQIHTLYPKAIHCAFVHSYDVEKWLVDLTNDEKSQVIASGASGKNVFKFGEYRIRYRSRKEFGLSYFKRDAQGQLIHKFNKKENKNMLVRNHVTIWDIFGFFQTSQAVAIETWLGKEHELLEHIKTMKSERANFTGDMRQEIIDYCFDELKALIELVTKVHDYSVKAGITLRRWDGAGAVAGALLRKYDFKQYVEDLPPEIDYLSRFAYFGGRIELLKIGHTDKQIWHYDINSAYPSHARNLPALKGGKWIHHKGYFESDNLLVLYHVKWNDKTSPFTRSCMYPFPFRTKQNMVYYPHAGEGWYWAPEIKIALKYFKNIVKIVECWEFIPASNNRPFFFIDELFQLRREMIQQKEGAEKMIKLGLNSLYGKMAQKIGSYDEKDEPRPPSFHNLAYAGYITSATRAQLLDAGLQHPDDIIMFQTDGIMSLSPLDVAISETKELGKWECDTFHGLTAVQSGVYWHTTEEGKLYGYIRGFDKKDAKTGKPSLSQEMVIDAWKKQIPQKKKSREIYNGDFGELQATITRFLTWRGARHSEKLIGLHGTFYTMAKALQLGPGQTTKRIIHPKYEVIGVRKFPKLWETFIDTLSATPLILQNGIAHSYQYCRPWDKEYQQLLDTDGTPLSISEWENDLIEYS